MSIIKPDGKDERKKLKAEPGINPYDCFLTTKQLIMITLSIAWTGRSDLMTQVFLWPKMFRYVKVIVTFQIRYLLIFLVLKIFFLTFI
jgi:hypothetical protein